MISSIWIEETLNDSLVQVYDYFHLFLTSCSILLLLRIPIITHLALPSIYVMSHL